MLSTFAVIPDALGVPTAFFPDLEDALDWALQRYGSDRFVIRGLALRTLRDSPAGLHMGQGD
jgi:hypothetical protein